jgi:hypothetical protein
MVSRAIGRTLATPGGLVALAAMPGIGLPQSPSRFRPRVVDGELGCASPVVVRYYLNH